MWQTRTNLRRQELHLSCVNTEGLHLRIQNDVDFLLVHAQEVVGLAGDVEVGVRDGVFVGTTGC